MSTNQKQLASKFKSNSQKAVINRKAFALMGTDVISLVGSAGSGKTALIEAAARLAHRTTFGAIIGNLAASRDAERLQRLGVRAIPVLTDNLTAEHVAEVLEEFETEPCDVLFIESGGNVESPVEYDFGQTARVAVFSVAGGDDKGAAQPRLVADADLIVLTKADLLPYVTFDLDSFRADVSTLNPEASIISTAAMSSRGFAAWLTWLGQCCGPARPSSQQRRRFCSGEPLDSDSIFKIEGDR